MATTGSRVKFVYCTAAKYSALTTKDENTIYMITDSQKVALGSTMVGNAGQAASNATNIGTLTNLKTTAKGNLVAALNEVNDAVSDAESAGTITVSETDGGWVITQNGITKGTIPKDTAVSSGELVEATSSSPISIGSNSYTSGQFLKLTIKNQSAPVYINVNELMNVYTGTNGTMVNVSVSGTQISASINDGSITKAKLASSVQTSLGKADTAMQSIAKGSVTKAMLAAAVQTSLGKADTAMQSIGAGTVTKTMLESSVQTSLGKADTALQSVPTYTGATSSAAGTAGLVPAAAPGQNTRFLRGDGTWVAISVPAAANNATITINKNGKSAGSFTTNQSSAGSINITDPDATTSVRGYMTTNQVTTLNDIDTSTKWVTL